MFIGATFCPGGVLQGATFCPGTNFLATNELPVNKSQLVGSFWCFSVVKGNIWGVIFHFFVFFDFLAFSGSSKTQKIAKIEIFSYINVALQSRMLVINMYFWCFSVVKGNMWGCFFHFFVILIFWHFTGVQKLKKMAKIEIFDIFLDVVWVP